MNEAKEKMEREIYIYRVTREEKLTFGAGRSAFAGNLEITRGKHLESPGSVPKSLTSTSTYDFNVIIPHFEPTHVRKIPVVEQSHSINYCRVHLSFFLLSLSLYQVLQKQINGRVSSRSWEAGMEEENEQGLIIEMTGKINNRKK